MAFKGKRAGSWGEASAVYGKSGDAWLYAKNVYGKKDGVWTNAWTDCRQHDATGGRDWIAAAGVTEYQLTCNNRQSRVRTDYTKTGCTPYSRYTDWVASPNCTGCFTSSTSTVYSGSCGNRTSATRTTYTPTSGSGCTLYYEDGAYTADPYCNVYDTGCYENALGAYEYRYSCGSRESRIVYTFNPKTSTACGVQYVYTDWVASPTCDGGCTTLKTGDFSQGGISYIYSGPPGEYVAYPNPFCSNGCDWSAVYFTVTTCNGTNNITETFRDVCRNVFGDPC